jgi:hypothetical protein
MMVQNTTVVSNRLTMTLLSVWSIGASDFDNRAETPIFQWIGGSRGSGGPPCPADEGRHAGSTSVESLTIDKGLSGFDG